MLALNVEKKLQLKPLSVSLCRLESCHKILMYKKKGLSQNSIAQILILLEMRSVLLFLDVLHIQVMILFFFLSFLLAAVGFRFHAVFLLFQSSKDLHLLHINGNSIACGAS